MNNIAISPYIGMHALQIQNIKRNVVKKVNIQELNMDQQTTNIATNQDQLLPITEQVDKDKDTNTDTIDNIGTPINDLYNYNIWVL